LKVQNLFIVEQNGLLLFDEISFVDYHVHAVNAVVDFL